MAALKRAGSKPIAVDFLDRGRQRMNFAAGHGACWFIERV
jgi:hypothetical protein